MRKKVSGTGVRPRLSVFRSGHHIYAQVVDDERMTTLVAASSRDKDLTTVAKSASSAPSKGGQGAAKETKEPETTGDAAEGSAGKQDQPDKLAPIASNRRVAQARLVGLLVAQRAQAKGIAKVVFDRGGYLYHGRVAALAAGAREGGLEF